MACTFDSSSEAFSDGESADPFAADGAIGDPDAGGSINPRSGDAGADIEPVSLYSDTAIVRYFLDDEILEDDPELLQDAIGAPELPLTLISPEDATEFVGIASQHGIRFNEITDEARLAVAIQNTKIRDRLNGSPTGTIELVLDVETVLLQGSRLSDIGDGVGSGRFSLRSSTFNSIEFYMNDALAAYWSVDVYGAGRMVLHLVVDTTRDSSGERIRLYLNGEEQDQLVSPLFPPDTPAKNEAIDISNTQEQSYVLGNRAVGGRSVQGTFHYAAMYSGAMSADMVANNASLLLVSDDSAQITGQ